MAADSVLVKRVVELGLSRIGSPADMAKVLEVSPAALKKEFQKTEGLSLSRYVSNIRLSRAMELLSESDLECRVICFVVGFSREDVGARAFKRCTGVTMSEYRKFAREKKVANLS